MTPERLKQFRESRGWSHVEAARQTGTSRNSWPGWESPDGKPPKWMGLVLAAIAYNLTPYE